MRGSIRLYLFLVLVFPMLNGVEAMGKLKRKKITSSAKKLRMKKSPSSVVPVSSKWLDVQKKSKDTVVQIFISSTTFSWSKPFKTPSQSRSWGTGFFINKMGYIVSNFHVIEDAVSVKIQIPSLGKERFDVQVIGGSPDRDIALLKLTSDSYKKITKKLNKIPFLSFGDSDKVVRTQEILALGYPLGQEKLKSTQGIVSGRENLWGDSYIQVTAAINSGNSGGPSVNDHGEVVGINTASITRAQNVGYIIPINDVKSVIKDLHNVKILRKPLFGAAFNNASDDMVTYLGNPAPGGYYISRVYKDTLFDRAGVRGGDMLYSINGHKFDKYGETVVPWSDDRIPLPTLMNRFKLGEKLTIEIYRNGKRLVIPITFDLLDDLPIRRVYPHYEKVDYEVIGGMVVMQMTLNHVSLFEDSSPLFNKYNLRENQYTPRLLVTHVFHDSQTREARAVYSGDLLKEVNGINVSTLDEFRNAVLESDEYLSIKTENKKLMVLSIRKIVKQEDKLAKRNFFKKSSLVEQLEKEIG